MRSRMYVAMAIGLIAAVSACETSTDPGDDGGGNGAVSITLSAATLNVVAGVSGSTTVTANRSGGFSGAVSISVEGLPAGVTVSPNPATIGGDNTTVTLTFATTAATAAGVSTITVRATGTGVQAATATLTLTITAVTQQGSFTLSMNPATLSIQAGSQNTSNVTITRAGGFAGAIALAVTGAPTGVTATLNPTSATANTSVLTVAVGASVAAGTHTLTITGTGTGVANQTTTLGLTVTATTGGSGNTTYQFCPASGLPAWFAYQDGTGGAWTRVTANASNQYIFNIASARGGVAWVTTDASGGSSVLLYYGTQQELSGQGGGQCGTNPTAPTKTINGSVANVGATESATISFNGGTATVSPLTGGNNFTLTGVRDGSGDIIAGRSAQVISGSGIVVTLNKGIFRRSQNPANGSTLPVFDFNASEAWTPVSRNLTVNGLGANENAIVSAGYVTSGGGYGSLYVEALGASSGNRQYFGVPAASQQNGDLHLLTVTALNINAGSTIRTLQTFFKDAIDKTVTLGPSPSTVAVSSVATARLRFVYSLQPEYNQYLVFSGSQASGAAARQHSIFVSAGYLAGAATADFTVPDLTTVAGWNTLWNLVAGTSTTWYFSASGWTGTGGIFGGPTAEGAVIRAGATTGTITP